MHSSESASEAFRLIAKNSDSETASRDALATAGYLPKIEKKVLQMRLLGANGDQLLMPSLTVGGGKMKARKHTLYR